MENHIKAARTELGLTQAALAKKLGVSSHAVESWEQGRRTPSIPTMKLLEFILTEHEKTSETS